MQRPWVYGRPCEEFLADMERASREALDDGDYGLFRMHFLKEQDWRRCCQRTGLDRAQFFYRIYQIEEKLGRAYVERVLCPTGRYFSRQGCEPQRLDLFGERDRRHTRRAADADSARGGSTLRGSLRLPYQWSGRAVA
jgi:hypothetical protein